jgi:tRNA pseudouridine55 synthase
MTPSILLLDKPLGLSSNAALQKVRWLFGKPRPKAGHTGTLDPLATGMLPICLGEATKFAGQLLSESKCYRTRIAFGIETASGDRDGETVATAALPKLEAERVEAVLRDFTGIVRQTPPAYSAIKQDGVPLYRLARAGIPVQPGQRDVRIDRITALEVGAAYLDLEVECGSGTYIRTLGMDIARALGSVGHLASLRRLWVAPFQGRAMASIDDVATWRERPSDSPPWLLPVEAALPGFAVLALDAAAVSALRQGRRVAGCDRPAGTYRLHDAGAVFFGLGDVDEAGVLRVRRLLATSEP